MNRAQRRHAGTDELVNMLARAGWGRLRALPNSRLEVVRALSKGPTRLGGGLSGYSTSTDALALLDLDQLGLLAPLALDRDGLVAVVRDAERERGLRGWEHS